MSRLDWTYDEVVLAADLVARHGWQGVRAANPEATELSSLLRSAPIHPVEGRPDNFRSPNSVQRKTFDIATQHPEYRGVPTKGGRHEAGVVLEFIEDPGRMTALAQEIRARIISGADEGPLPDLDLEALSADEGRALAVSHLRRERDPKLRRAKLDSVRRRGHPLACEVCGFDFHAAYGDVGEGYIEVHHIVPLHASGPVVTRLDDLALLCSNCHRMVHRSRPWLTPGELRTLLRVI